MGKPTMSELSLNDFIKQCKGQKITKSTNPNKISKKFIVKNIDLETTNKQLYDLFSQAGTLIKCKLDLDKFGRSNGSAVIEYEKLDEAQKALNSYNEHELGSRKIRIKMIFPKQTVKRMNPKNTKKVIFKKQNVIRRTNGKKNFPPRKLSNDSRNNRTNRVRKINKNNNQVNKNSNFNNSRNRKDSNLSNRSQNSRNTNRSQNSGNRINRGNRGRGRNNNFQNRTQNRDNDRSQNRDNNRSQNRDNNRRSNRGNDEGRDFNNKRNRNSRGRNNSRNGRRR